jgi:hypothetical protein
MAAFLPPAIFEIKAVADKAIAEFKKVNGELEKLEDKADKAGASVSKINTASRFATAGLLAAGAAFAGFAAIGVKGVIEDEKAFTKLGQTFSNLGINIEANRQLVSDLDAAYSKLGFGGDETADALNKLLSTTNDLEMSQGLLSISADLARAKNIDLATAASVVGRASMGNAKAFKEMGIVLDTTLPRAEAITKAMEELNEKVGGQATAYTKTFAGQLVVLREEISAVADTVGAALLPYLKQMVTSVSKSIEFIKNNSAAFKILAGVIITVTVALASYNAAIKVQMALTKAWAVITGVQAAVTKLLTGQQIALNTAMKLNPVGLVVSAVMLLIGGFLLLWNKSETFRKMMIQIGKVGVMAFGFLIGVVGDLAVGLLKIATGPLKLLLQGLALLGVGPAKTALKGLETATEGVGKFFDSASKKVTGMANSLDKLNKPIKLTFAAPPGVPDLPNTGGAKSKTSSGTKLDPKVAAANEKYMSTVKDLQDKIRSATEKANEKLVELAIDYAEKISDLQADAADKIARLMRDADEKRLKAKVDMDKKITDAQKRFNDTMADLNKKLAKDQTKLEEDNAKAIENIKKQNADKLQSIVQQSIDRLRNAFKSGTTFSVGDLFKGLVESGKSSVDDLIKALRNKLDGARLLAENAGRLASLGYSQTFIEQVVSQGPDLGNALATSLLKSGTATTDELQTIYKELETLNESGLNTLATKFNEGNILATSELNAAYASAKAELSVFLTEQQTQYQNSQAELMTAFTESMAEAEKTRDDAIATARADYAETIAEINKTLAQDIADVQSELAKSMADALKEYNKATADVQKELGKALAEIQKLFQEKLANITSAVNATKAAIKSLIAELMAAQALAASLAVKSTTTVNYSGGGGTATGGGTTQMVNNNNTNVQISTTNLTNPQDIANATISAIKYGQTVVVAPVGMTV